MAITRVVFSAIIIGYPLIVYIGIRFFEAKFIAFALIVVAAIRLALFRQIYGRIARIWHSNLIMPLLLVVGILALVMNSHILLQYYPVLINALMLTLFSLSLIRPPSIVEQIARIKTPDLPEAAIAYTRKVTMVWCGFFVVNGSIALYTILDSTMRFWAIYNGLISYCLMGLLFAGEYVIRLRAQRRLAHGRGGKRWH